MSGEPVLAVDLGGTNVRVAAVTPPGDIVTQVRESTPVDDPGTGSLVELMERVHRTQPCRGAVVGVPGTVDYRARRVHQVPNLPRSWVPSLSAQRFSEDLGIPVALANDADLAAVGETYFGAGREHDNVVYLTVSTGIGAGVVLRQKLVHGAWSMAELGHTVVDATALAQGRPASLEELGSGTALARLASEAGLEVTDGTEVMNRVRSGDVSARAVWDEIGRAIGIGVVNAAWTFAPDVIVIGGGVGLNEDLVLPPARAALDAHGPRNLPEPILLTTARLGDDAGLLGAAAWDVATT